MDRSLVERAQRGDREAFSRLAFELSDRLFAVAHRILRDFDAAGDALQVTLLRIWRDLPGLRDPGRAEAWAYRVVVRACHDELRKLRRQTPALHLLAMDGASEDPAVSIADREQLDRAFLTLSTEQRVVIVLHYYRDLSMTEIAEVLEVPLGTVRSRLHYARRALRSAIEADARPTTREGRTA
jgi:RNA polymerase sigma-70 factor, ECF subfamily